MGLIPELPAGAQLVEKPGQSRYIEERSFVTRWLLEYSLNSVNWLVLSDKRNANSDLPHDLVVNEKGINARYVRLTVTDTAYHAPACVSGLRIFGKGNGAAPVQATEVTAKRIDGMSMHVAWKGDALGYEVLWGHSPDKLYHSYRLFSRNQLEIHALMANVERYYVRIDAFNENGITEGVVISASSSQ